MAEENPIEAVEPDHAHLDFAKADHEHAEYAHVGHNHEDLESRLAAIEEWINGHHEWHKEIDHTHEPEKEESAVEKEAEPVIGEPNGTLPEDDAEKTDGATHISVTEEIKPSLPAHTNRHGLRSRRR